jgi:hypothetical protein
MSSAVDLYHRAGQEPACSAEAAPPVPTCAVESGAEAEVHSSQTAPRMSEGTRGGTWGRHTHLDSAHGHEPVLSLTLRLVDVVRDGLRLRHLDGEPPRRHLMIVQRRRDSSRGAQYGCFSLSRPRRWGCSDFACCCESGAFGVWHGATERRRALERGKKPTLSRRTCIPRYREKDP